MYTCCCCWALPSGAKNQSDNQRHATERKQYFFFFSCAGDPISLSANLRILPHVHTWLRRDISSSRIICTSADTLSPVNYSQKTKTIDYSDNTFRVFEGKFPSVITPWTALWPQAGQNDISIIWVKHV